MDSRARGLQARHPERGATLVIVAFSMVALLGFTALAVDLAYLYVAKNELQNVADAAALAATRTLGHIYQGIPSEDQPTYECLPGDQAVIRQAAYDVAGQNHAAGVEIVLREVDVSIGQWDGNSFSATYDQPDAVEVIARRDENENNPVTTFFARVLGIDEVPLWAIATAAMTGQGTTQEGELLFPVTLSEYFFEGDASRCNDYIKFSPTDSTSCGGWTTWDDKSSSALLRKILDGDNVSPAMTAGDDRIWTTGGDVAAAFPNMMALFQKMGCATTDGGFPDGSGDPLARTDLAVAMPGLDLDDNGCVDWDEARGMGIEGAAKSPYPWLEDGEQAYYPDWDKLSGAAYEDDLDAPRYFHRWETSVPVYDYAEGGADECSNPGSRTKWLITGFAPVVITDVIGPPDNTIIGRVLCDRVSNEDNRGGGGNYGIKGPIPGLVR
jgi:hypothetical protein